MAQINLVNFNVTDSMVRVGHEITGYIEESGIDIVASFWLYDDEAHRYYLNVASGYFEENGPLKLYKKIQDVLMEKNVETITLNDIKVLGGRSQLINSMLESLGSVVDKPIKSRLYNGNYIEDAYILKLGSEKQ